MDEDYYIEVKENYRMGIINHETPGPIEGAFQLGNGIVLSKMDRSEMAFPLIQEAEYEFDDLPLPFHIPLFFCNQSGQSFCNHGNNLVSHSVTMVT